MQPASSAPSVDPIYFTIPDPESESVEAVPRGNTVYFAAPESAASSPRGNAAYFATPFAVPLSFVSAPVSTRCTRTPPVCIRPRTLLAG